MQRIDQNRPHRVRGHRPVLGERQPIVPGANGVAAATGVATLAPAFAQAMPSLDGIVTEYTHELHAELVYDLCSALVREGFGTPDIWKKCGENAKTFAEHAIMSAIGEDRWNLLRRNVEYHLQVSDVTEVEGYDQPLENGSLLVTIECGSAGYLKIGPALDTLEQEAEGLGAAFYWELTYALYRIMRIYNHDDAMQYEERMREYAEDDEEENREQYEFPEIGKALPECVRKSLEDTHKRQRADARRLLSRYRHSKHRSWIERLRRIQQLSRVPLRQSRNVIEEGNYDSPPLPSLLVAFKDHDAIIACFDEESQYMLEASSEPAVAVVFCPQKPEEVRHALRMVGRFIALNQELFQLVEELQEGEKRDADTRLHRTEPSLRAA
jgi:hypothetical protein